MNLFWAGLATLASKRFDRDLIQPGSFPLNYRINGDVGGKKTKEAVAGSLVASPNQLRTSNNKPKSEELLAAAFFQMTAPTRKRVMEALISGELQSDSNCQMMANQIIAANTKPSVGSVRGSLAFQTD